MQAGRQVVATRSDILRSIDRYCGVAPAMEAAATEFAGAGAAVEAGMMISPSSLSAGRNTISSVFIPFTTLQYGVSINPKRLMRPKLAR